MIEKNIYPVYKTKKEITNYLTKSLEIYFRNKDDGREMQCFAL